MDKLKSYYDKGDYMDKLKVYYKTKKEKFNIRKEHIQNFIQNNMQKVFDEREKTKKYRIHTRYTMLLLFSMTNIYFIFKFGRFSYTFFIVSAVIFLNLNIMINYKLKAMYKKRIKELREDFMRKSKADGEKVKNKEIEDSKSNPKV